MDPPPLSTAVSASIPSVRLLSLPPVGRIVAYYAALFGGGALLWRLVPPGARAEVLAVFAPLLLGGRRATGGGSLFGPDGAFATGADLTRHAPVGLEVIGAVLGAFLLAIPVAWTYMLVRERKGYRQTTVHTLVLLPVVVAGVVVLVKTSVALAFSLAGIVAAVRFRSSLDDSKDATFLFLATGLGLACGVELDVALVLSVLFNVGAIVLFYTDFGRTPPALEGERARRQMERALAIANRTSQFVARVDEEVLASLNPEQLDALALRVRRRRDEVAPDLPPVLENQYDARLCVTATDAVAARAVLAPLLDARVKRWVLDVAVPAPEGNGCTMLAYHVRWKKGTPPTTVLDAVRADGAPFVVRAELG